MEGAVILHIPSPLETLFPCTLSSLPVLNQTQNEYFQDIVKDYL